MSSSPSLSIVVPAFNEKENVPLLVEAIRQTIPLLCPDYEVIIIDDASTDGTSEMLDAITRTEPKLRILHNEERQTLGGSLRKGFNAATKELILYFDADLPFDLKEIALALAIICEEKADFLSAYRNNRSVEGVRRFLCSFFYNAIVEFLFNLGIKDVNFSFKLFKRGLLEEMALSSDGSFIDAEMLIKVRIAGRKIVQLPVIYYPRKKGRSTLSGFGTIVKILQELGRFFPLYYRDIKRKRTEMNRFRRLLCSHASWWVKAYGYVRFKTCPFEKIEAYVPKEGKILDLGCGFGFFDMWLHQQSGKREIVALDRQEKRITWNRQVCEREKMRLEFITADYNTASFGIQDAILLVDTLYLLPHEQQKHLLSKCYQALSSGGKLLIKEMDRSPRLKYFWLLLQECFVTKIANLNHSRNIYIMPWQEMAGFLTNLGFAVEVLRLDRGYFCPHIMFSCFKK